MIFKISRVGLLLIMLLPLVDCQQTQTPPAAKRAQALEDLGNALVREGKLKEGIKNYLEAYKLSPDNPDLNHEIALCYRELEQYEESKRYFEKAISLRPQFSDAENNFGTLFLIMRQWDAAILHFQKAVSDPLYQTPHFAYNNMGMAYSAKGDLANAIANYKKAIQIFPAFAVCYKNLGLAFEASKNTKDAADAYIKAIQNSTPADPEHTTCYFYLGKLYLKAGQKKDAKQAFTKVLELDPRAPFAEEAKKLLNSIKP